MVTSDCFVVPFIRPVSCGFGLRAREYVLQVPRILRSPGGWPSHGIYSQLTSTNLQRVRQATELVHRPGSDIHEFRNRLIPGPPQTLSVVVTDRRVTVGEKTYALGQLASVSVVEHAKSIGCALVFVGLGALMLVGIMCSAFTFSQFQ